MTLVSGLQWHTTVGAVWAGRRELYSGSIEKSRAFKIRKPECVKNS
jgi:hypothetical protein